MNEACHRFGTQPPSVEPTRAANRMTRLDDTLMSYSTSEEAPP